MSHQAFVDFYESFLNNPQAEALRTRLDAINDANEFCASMAAAGAENGFDFTAEEVREVMKASEAQMARAVAQASGELSEDQLDAVAGGATYIKFDGISTVNIRSVSSFMDPSQFEYRTVMCPW